MEVWESEFKRSEQNLKQTSLPGSRPKIKTEAIDNSKNIFKSLS